jgi:DNA-directed RNA polymerase subunit RPC12/RpoP
MEFLMKCQRCGAAMNQAGKDTFSGRDIREYECPKCGHSDWEDQGKALWQILSDERERDEAEEINRAPASSRDSHPESSESKARSANSGWGRLRALFAHFFERKQ